MKAHVKILHAEKIEKILQVSKSAYYASVHRKPSMGALENQALLDKIKQVHLKSRCIYGRPKIHIQQSPL